MLASPVCGLASRPRCLRVRVVRNRSYAGMHLIYAILWTARRLLQLVLSYGLHSVLCIFSCINLHDLWSACISSMLSYRLHVAYCIPMNCTQLMQHPWGGPYRPHAAYAATQTFVPYAITRCLYATIAYAITRCLCNHCSCNHTLLMQPLLIQSHAAYAAIAYAITRCLYATIANLWSSGISSMHVIRTARRLLQPGVLLAHVAVLLAHAARS